MVFKASLKRRLSAKAVWTSGASRRLGFGSKARDLPAVAHPRERVGVARAGRRQRESRGGGGRDER
jgi:hypothetical protein